MMRRTQYGFAHLALVLLLLVIVVVSFAGYTVYKNRQDTVASNKTSTAVTSTTVKTINSTSDLNGAATTLDGQAIDSDLNPDQLNSDISNLL